MVKRKYFGTDGIRGKANESVLNSELALRLGRAVTHYFQSTTHRKKPVIVIGKDTRLSCYMLEQAFASGVCAQGGEAIFTGPLPTPGVAFVTKSLRANAGVMISASHNSFEDNGIKIFDQYGIKLPDEVEAELEFLLDNPSSMPLMTGVNIGRARRVDEIRGRYIVFVKSVLDEKVNLEGLKIVLDCANGAAWRMGPMIFEESGVEVIPLGITPNGININEKCGAIYPETCAKKVIETSADLGICLDGDSDRLVLIDHKGEIVAGDITIGLLAKYLVEKKEFIGKEVVGTSMSNLGLELFIKNLGFDFVRADVGDRYIIEKMLQNNSFFGGEPSGHIIMRNYSTTGDGILAALKILELLKYKNQSLNELKKEISLFPQTLKNYKMISRIDFEKIEGLTDLMNQCQKDLGNNGRLLLRYSGTEALLRVMIESSEQSKIEYWLAKFDLILDKYKG